MHGGQSCTHLKGYIMRSALVSVVMILCITVCVSASDIVTKDALEKQKLSYELQERCGKQCEHWSKKIRDGMNYRAHYNSHLNKCFALATLCPLRVDEGQFSDSIEVLYDVNENTQYGHLTTRFYDNSDRATFYQCTVNRNKAEQKGYAGDEAKQKWAIFVKEMMED